MQSITDLCWYNWRTFWRKKSREGDQVGLVLARQCPTSPGTCNPEETVLPGLPMSWSPTLFSGSGPVRLPPVPWTEKTIDLVGRTNFWIFLSGLQKLEQVRSILSFVGSMLNKSRVWSLELVSFLVRLRTYQHPVIYANIIIQIYDL
jgi:hypothetical protein